MKQAVACALFITMITLLSAGCGFQPLHGVHGERADLLQKVWIRELSGERGQDLRNKLIDRFYNEGYPETARYNLTIDIDSFSRNLDIKKDDTATRAQLILRANYRLIDRMDNDRVIHSATVRSVNSYNILDSQFTTQVTREDAEKRSIVGLADQIERRLILFLSQRYGT